MRLIVPIAMMALLTFTGSVSLADPKVSSDELLFPLPAEEVAAGKFEKLQLEAAKKPSNVIYHRFEYDRKVYWVVEASFGFGDPSFKIAIYAPTKAESFKRCLLAGPIKAGNLSIAIDAKKGILNISEASNRSTNGEVLLSCNLKTVGVLP